MRRDGYYRLEPLGENRPKVALQFNPVGGELELGYIELRKTTSKCHAVDLPYGIIVTVDENDKPIAIEWLPHQNS